MHEVYIFITEVKRRGEEMNFFFLLNTPPRPPKGLRPARPARDLRLSLMLGLKLELLMNL